MAHIIVKVSYTNSNENASVRVSFLLSVGFFFMYLHAYIKYV